MESINDTDGHHAGDAALERAMIAIRPRVRSYDLVVRGGDDEFLCAMCGVTIEEARRRFEAVQEALAGPDGRRALRVGFGVLQPRADASELIARADAALQAIGEARPIAPPRR